MKNFLFALRNQDLIDENQLLNALNGLKKASQVNAYSPAPLLDMIQLIYIEETLHQVKNALQINEVKTKQAALSWDAGRSTKAEARHVISELVKEREKLEKREEKLHTHIPMLIARLKGLEENNRLNLDTLFPDLPQSDVKESTSRIISKFSKVWEKWADSSRKDEFPTPTIPSAPMEDVERDIISRLISPLGDEQVDTLNLGDLIQPLGQVSDNLSASPVEDISAVNPPNPIEVQMRPISTPDSNPWDVVGKVAIDTTGNPLGVFRPPIIVDDTTFLPIVKEEPISIAILKQRYQKILKQAKLDLKKVTTEQIKTTIAKALGIPRTLALQPSFFNNWLHSIGGYVTPVKPHLNQVNFITIPGVTEHSANGVTIDEGALTQLRVPVWIPAPGNPIITDVGQVMDQDITGMGGSHFGKISGLMSGTPFGQALLIKRDVPPSFILTLFLEGLGIQNLAALRFHVAKELSIGEGEAFSPASLWTMNTKERLLISPHELAASYFSVLPSAAFNFGDKIHAKVGVYFTSIPETFRYLIGKPFVTNDQTGVIYGFVVDSIQHQFEIIWTSKSPVEIIKEVGRKSSEQYVNRFKQRISLALGTSYQESLWPSNLARYFLNFIWMEENLSLLDAQRLIETRFSLQRTPFSSVEEITQDGARCKSSLG
ncbi:MAG: hypothetical protein ACFFE8_03775 [Candidatus Heimdallarchaeota archaeon]